MIDEDIAAVSPASVYRILKEKNLLYHWNGKKSSAKGNGFKQPTAPNEHWHMDIAYINVMGTFMFLISVLDGYSRMIIHHELRTTMTEYDVQITLPQSNGKIERFHGTIKSEAIRQQSYLSIDDACQQIADYIQIYNEERLHSALFYLTPKEVFEGKMEQRLEERQKKLDQAADPPAPDIGGRAGNRKILSLFERSENSISL